MRLKRGTRGSVGANPVVLDAVPEVWAHCPACDHWFVVEDPGLDTLLLCPVDLRRADVSEVRLPA